MSRLIVGGVVGLALAISFLVQHAPSPPDHVSIALQTAASPGAISPLIYGIVGDRGQLQATGARLNRWGGNPNSRYNWVQGSAWNAARDWEFRNYGQLAAGASSAADDFVETNRSLGAQSMLTIPAIGWVARNADTETRSVDVPRGGGPPLANDPEAIAGYDPAQNRARTSVRSVARKDAPFDDPPDASAEVVYQDEWVNHLVNRFGTASSGGVGFYVIDNEPDLWSITHSDVHPVEPGYDDMLTTYLTYAEAIKAVDPTTAVMGPALSGWTALLYSARDRGSDNFRTHLDRRAHGDMPFLAWWLDQVRQHDEQVGHRTLDVLDVHFYPQAPGVFAGSTDEGTAPLRLRSTRSLWDGAYTDESWIRQPVQLVPRMRALIDRFYPGTRLGIGEWNWGADQTMNGALAIADVLGIYGREGVYLAAYWTSPPPGSPGAFAFAMYTNYDGLGHGFGDQSLAASSDHPDAVSAFGSRDTATGDLLLLLANQRDDADISATLLVDGLAPTGQVQVFRYGAADPAAIRQVATELDGGEIVLPRTSLTLVRLSRR